jgi:hypothetical protein
LDQRFQKKDFHDGVIVRENFAVGDVLTHLRMQALNRICGVYDAPELDWVLEERRKVIPRLAPGHNGHRITPSTGLAVVPTWAVAARLIATGPSSPTAPQPSGNHIFQANNQCTAKTIYTDNGYRTALWARLIAERESELPSDVAAAIEQRCPGFLTAIRSEKPGPIEYSTWF